ncbi:hydroxymethylbilane synthase [Corynebacterium sp. 35RC1]|nr:hydroxymethylbilane synthase [Corynebacterium sp. 35RC1]
MRTFALGTRGSLLATTQSGHVIADLAAHGVSAEIHIVTTPGDVNMAPVERIGVGVFTQALRDALERGECDIAVHSMKDLPTAPDPRFVQVVPQRADARDCLIARDGLTLADLPQGAKVGTGAPRRISQIKALRPDVECVPIRGNIDTRIAKVTSGELDAVVLAYAGLCRVGREAEATEVFDPKNFLPAPAQGALAVECRVDDAEASAALETLIDAATARSATAERAVLRALEAGCTAPVAAHATVEGDELELSAAVIALDGTRKLVHSQRGPATEAEAIGQEVAEALLAQGAADILN